MGWRERGGRPGARQAPRWGGVPGQVHRSSERAATRPTTTLHHHNHCTNSTTTKEQPPPLTTTSPGAQSSAGRDEDTSHHIPPSPCGTARASRSAGQHSRRCSGLGVGERLLRSKPVRKRSHGQSSRGGSGRERGASPTANHHIAHDKHHIKNTQSHCKVYFFIILGVL